MVVEDMRCTLLLHQLSPTIRAGRADDTQSPRDSELHRGDAHATAGTVNEDGFAWNGLGFLEECATSRRVWHAYGRALGKDDIIGKRMNLRCGADGELGIRAGAYAAGSSKDVHPVAGLPRFYAIADGFNDSRAIRAGSERKCGADRVGAGADVGVDRIHAGGMQSNQHLSRARFR